MKKPRHLRLVSPTDGTGEQGLPERVRLLYLNELLEAVDDFDTLVSTILLSTIGETTSSAKQLRSKQDIIHRAQDCTAKDEFRLLPCPLHQNSCRKEAIQ